MLNIDKGYCDTGLEGRPILSIGEIRSLETRHQE